MEDLYLKQMTGDLKEAEAALRHELRQEFNQFPRNSAETIRKSQANVDRLHELIRSHLHTPEALSTAEMPSKTEEGE